MPTLGCDCYPAQPTKQLGKAVRNGLALTNERGATVPKRSILVAGARAAEKYSGYSRKGV